MLILSGSLIGMMKKHALSYDSPLYGRRTAQIRLMPLPFTAVYAAQSLPFDQAVQQYALTGGVPKYLEFFTEQEPLIDQIRSIVLSKTDFYTRSQTSCCAMRYRRRSIISPSSGSLRTAIIS